MAFIGAIFIVFFFLICILFVKESYKPPQESEEDKKKGIVKKAMGEFGSTFKNPAFRPYLVGVFFYRMSIMIILTITPFIATKILAAYPATETDMSFLSILPQVVGENGVINWEPVAGYMMMLVLGGAVILFIPVSLLTGWLGKRILFIISLVWLGLIMILMSTIGMWSFTTPLYQAITLFQSAAGPVAIALVVMRPLLADVIDEDEKLTNKRREGVYNGMEGLIMKFAAGLGPLLVGIIFSAFGNTLENPTGIIICGPVSGVCLLAAAYAFTRYPIKK